MALVEESLYTIGWSSESNDPVIISENGYIMTDVVQLLEFLSLTDGHQY